MVPSGESAELVSRSSLDLTVTRARSLQGHPMHSRPRSRPPQCEARRRLLQDPTMHVPHTADLQKRAYPPPSYRSIRTGTEDHKGWTGSLLLPALGDLLALEDLLDDLGLLNQERPDDSVRVAQVMLRSASATRTVRQRCDTHLSRTHLPQREPPYARWTVFCRFEIVAYLCGRSAGTCTPTFTSASGCEGG